MKNMRAYLLGVGSGLILGAVIITLLGIVYQPEVKLSPAAGQLSAAQNPPKYDKGNNNEVNTRHNVPAEKTETGTEKLMEIIIPPGTTATEIADLLLENKIIRDKNIFLHLVSEQGVSGKFRAGKYSLPVGLTEQEALNTLLQK